MPENNLLRGSLQLMHPKMRVCGSEVQGLQMWPGSDLSASPSLPWA